MTARVVEGTACFSMVAIHGIEACGEHVPCSVYAVAAALHAAVGVCIFCRCFATSKHDSEEHAD